MFNFVQNNQVVIKVILGAVALTFVGFGVGSYTAAVDEPFAAKVGDVKILSRDVDRALEGQAADAANRQGVLDNLVRQQLLISEAGAAGIVPTDSQLRQAIVSIPAFQDGGKFSQQKYSDFIKSRYRSAADFESEIRKELMIQTQAMPYAGTHFVSRTASARLGELMSETRSVSSWVIPVASFKAKVALTDKQIQDFYEKNKQRFVTQESVDLEYVVLSLAELANKQQVSDAEAKEYYQKHSSEFGEEERKVSHILITAAVGASKAERDAARQKAEALQKQVAAAPESFASLAEKNSQDPGSAAQGGDLGYFAKGAMVKPFEDAAFSMQKGAISKVVETEFGFHVLKLDDIRGQDFDQIKSAVVDKLKKQKASALYRSQLEKAGDLAYQQPESLQPLAAAMGLTIQSRAGLGRQGVKDDALFGKDKVLTAAFTDDVLLKKHNSEVVEIDSATSLVLRVKAHQPRKQKSLEEVKAQIQSELADKEAGVLAEQAGKKAVSELQAGQAVAAVWGESRQVARSAAGAVDVSAIRTIFAASANKLPAYTSGRTATGDYVIYRIDAVNKAQAQPAEAIAQLNTILGQVSSNEVLASYLGALRAKHPVVMGEARQ